MSKIGYRIILEKDGKKIILLDQEINKPKNLFELGVNYEDQLNLIKGLPVVHTKKKKKNKEIFSEKYTYKNRNGRAYYLHQRQNKNGKILYTMSQNSANAVQSDIPAGYEAHENYEGRIFCRKKRPLQINPEEIQLIENALKKYVDYPFTDKHDKTIFLYSADKSHDSLSPFFEMYTPSDSTEDIEKLHHYTPFLKISLVDLNKRLFRCYHYDNYMSYEWIDNGISTLNEIIQEHLIKRNELDIPF